MGGIKKWRRFPTTSAPKGRKQHGPGRKPRAMLLSPLWGYVSNPSPAIRPECLRRQVVLVEQVRPRVDAAPGVADGDWLGDLCGVDDYRITVDGGVGPVELFVLAGYREALQLVAVLERQALADVGEGDANL